MSDGTERPSKWIPITCLLDLAHLGKLGEETSELSRIAFRCIIQGVAEADPETQKPNNIALQEEIADVFATAELVIERWKLDRTAIHQRRERKIAMKRAWHEMLKA